jgi:glycerol-3-phosphate dehydrogenase
MTSSTSSSSCTFSIDEDRNDMKDTETSSDDDGIYDVVIVGGGIVGLSILRHATTCCGWKCVLVEKERHLLTQASGSNSGIICTGVDATNGTLERALIRDSISRIRPFLNAMNIPHRSCGSLVCQWSWDDQNAGDDDDDDDNDIADEQNDDADQDKKANLRLDKVLVESHEAGDLHATKLTPKQLLQREPNLNPSCASMGAVHIPGEIVVDPWLFSIAMAVHAQVHGATIITNFTMDPKRTTWNHVNKTWTVRRSLNDIDDSNSSSSNKHPILQLRARAVINATGLWSDQVQEQIHSQQRQQQQQQQQQHQKQNGHDDGGGPIFLPSTCGNTVLPPPHWTSRPRRGQYRVFASNLHTYIYHPVQPIPTLQTKGIFVFTSLYNQIIVGPTALEQKSKTNRQVNADVAVALTHHAQRLVPALDTERDYIGEWVGIRPGTDQRDYQIQIVSSAMPWISVAGIRSTGLTASLGIGRHVTDLLSQLLPLCQPSKKALSSVPNNNASSTTAACVGKEQARMIAAATPLPPLHELIDSFHRRGDGMVEINGHVYKVTHPITQFGWKTMTPALATTCTSQPRCMSKL